MAQKLSKELLKSPGSPSADQADAPIHDNVQRGPPANNSRTSLKCRSLVTIGDRLEYGKLSIDEVRMLAANRSKTGFYQDLKAGLVKIEKNGRKSSVLGPIAKRYIAGEPIDSASSAEARCPMGLQNENPHLGSPPVRSTSERPPQGTAPGKRRRPTGAKPISATLDRVEAAEAKREAV